MDLVQLHSLLAVVWQVWFVALFVGIVWFVMRPGKRRYYQDQGLIPFQDEATGPAPLRPRA